MYARFILGYVHVVRMQASVIGIAVITDFLHGFHAARGLQLGQETSNI